jgi:hypothetical protein
MLTILLLLLLLMLCTLAACVCLRQQQLGGAAGPQDSSGILGGPQNLHGSYSSSVVKHMHSALQQQQRVRP